MNANPCPLTDNTPERFVLANADGVLTLVDREQPKLAPASVEFPAHLLTAKGRSELPGQPLIRAFGRQTVTVVDATAGMGQDSLVLAIAGYQVTAFERSEKIAALLANGLDRIVADETLRGLVGDRLQINHADAIGQLQKIDPRPQAIYLDPMYPPKRKKSALAKKEIQFLRELVGDDVDAVQLFEVAMQTATERVVVKRPVYAEPLAARPSMSYQGKLVRFDVYLTALAANGREVD